MAGTDVRPGEALLDSAAAEGDGPREVRWKTVTSVQGPGSGLSRGSDTKTGRPQARPSQAEAQTPEVRPPTEPSLEAYALRERTTIMRPEVFTLLRTGSFDFAFTQEAIRVVIITSRVVD